VGKALTGAVTAYNQTVGSLESRVLVSARKLAQIGLVEDTQEAPRVVEEPTRLLSAPELTASVVPAPAPEPGAPGGGAPALAAPALPGAGSERAAPASPEGTPASATGAPAGEDATDHMTPASPEATPEPTPAAGMSLADSPAELFMAHTHGAAS
jgi:DNA recombination protein RmuC